MVGVIELPYMNEEQLRLLGIPLGPRTRILREAARLYLNPDKAQTTNSVQKNNMRNTK